MLMNFDMKVEYINGLKHLLVWVGKGWYKIPCEMAKRIANRILELMENDCTSEEEKTMSLEDILNELGAEIKSLKAKVADLEHGHKKSAFRLGCYEHEGRFCVTCGHPVKPTKDEPRKPICEKCKKDVIE